MPHHLYTKNFIILNGGNALALPSPIARLRDVAGDFSRKHHIRKMSLFGSYLDGTHVRGSDVDLLVEFEEGAIPSLFEIAAMEEELSGMLGERVELRTSMDLSKYFRDEVVSSSEVLYGEA